MFTVHKFKIKNSTGLEPKLLNSEFSGDVNIEGKVLVALALSGNGGAEIECFKGELLSGVLIRKSFNADFTKALGSMIFKEGNKFFLCDPASNGVTNVQELHSFKKKGVNFYYTTSFPMIYQDEVKLSR